VANTPTDAREQSKEVAATAIDEAREVGRTAQTAAQDVTHEVRQEVSQITSELKQQARGLVDDTRSQLRDKADSQTVNIADRLGGFAAELQALSNGHPEQAETVRRYIDQAGSAVADVAGQLRKKNFAGLVQDLQRFARRRPGAFLAASVAAGFVAGRLVRSAKDESEAETSPGPNGSTESSSPHTAPSPQAIADDVSPTGNRS
jgi:hypothetical protein